ncbi:MAG: flavodoxin family protein, partial [Desulfobaccales bacterium]
MAIAAYLALAVLGFWLMPGGLGLLMSAYPAAALYGIFFLMAAVPPLLGGDPFTSYFARRKTPASAWGTGVFKDINRRLTFFWSGLFAISFLSSLAPHFWPALGSPRLRFACAYVLPTALLAGIGRLVTRWYPGYRQRLLGLVPGEASPPPASGVMAAAPGGEPRMVVAIPKKGYEKMSEKRLVVAVNGSPHMGMGNTSQMIAMLKENLAPAGLDLEEIFLSGQHIEYCSGCALCLEKGSCWIRDDFKGVVKRVLEADAVILASPVYVRNITGQMKTFLDRSLGYGHRPRGAWKPGLALSVSAGWGETETAQYLSQTLRMFGAFAVGQLTAIAVGPGEFVGREAVAARAAD